MAHELAIDLDGVSPRWCRTHLADVGRSVHHIKTNGEDIFLLLRQIARRAKLPHDATCRVHLDMFAFKAYVGGPHGSLASHRHGTASIEVCWF